MLGQVLSLLLKREVADLKRRSAGGVLIAGGFMLLSLASLVGLAALYLWLSTRLDPWQAALAISVLLALLGGIIMLSGRSMVRRQHQMKQELDAYFKTLMNTAEKNVKPDKVGSPLSIVALAAIAGIVIGRKVRK